MRPIAALRNVLLRPRYLASAALALLAAACSAAPPRLPAGTAVGEPIAPRAALPLAAVVAKPDAHLEQTLLVEATIADVCQKKGCWMQVTDQGRVAMVRWECGCGGKYAFPKEAVGKRVLIEGSFYRKQISAADAAHLEGESSGMTVERDGFEMNASGVLVLDG